MFLSGTLIWLVEHGWLMFLHLSARSSFPKPLPKEEEQRLIEEMLNGDEEAGNRLIECNLRLVAHIAKKYSNAHVDQDDLISIGSIGLIKAVHTFRPEAGKLTTYASRCIENEMLMHLRSCKKNKNVVLMGESIGTDKDGNEMQLADLLGTGPNEVSDIVETSIESERAMQMMERILDDRELTVIRLRYGLLDGDPKPQHYIAGKLKISRSYVSRIEKKALEKLREELEKLHPREG